MGGRIWMAFVGVVTGMMQLAAQTPAAIRNQATDLIRGGKPVEAIALLEDAVAKAPADLRARNLLGVALSDAGRHEAAIEQFRLVLQQDPRFVAAVKNVAIEELQLGRDADARGHRAKALEMAPNDPWCITVWGSWNSVPVKNGFSHGLSFETAFKFGKGTRKPEYQGAREHTASVARPLARESRTDIY
jgi:Flp pilus assembly protein TadD